MHLDVVAQLPEISWLQAILLGVLQGLTEFLPVSSTAHMAIAPQLLFGMEDVGAAFSAIVQLGPIVAIIAYFRHDLARYWHGILRSKSPLQIPKDDVDARVGWYTLLGTIPICIFGVLLQKRIDNEFRRLDVIAVALIALAIVLWVAEIIGSRRRKLEGVTLKQSQIVGWAQVLSLVPGTSRSGVTITAGLLQGFDRESAARFSFLLSIPAITLAGLFKLYTTYRDSGLHGSLGPSVLGAIVAGVVAYVIVRWFLGYMKEHSTGVFIGYRIALGLLVLFLLHAGLIKDTHRDAAKNNPTNVSRVARSSRVASR